ncbi:MAG TPA: FAD-binding oxidoreductase [Hellea balneolensis]|uniref:D-lactate dehydrogenase (cytochrome) n=1 Tax=Hellea balneolensis TaxID=287478 RepID=A0A7C5QV35_9PROT|nr:FAD-binding oxidoreductase [Hellea balneolensis]
MSKLSNTVINTLAEIVGKDNLKTDLASRELYSQDIWSTGELADFVIFPHTETEMCQIVKLAAQHKIPLNPRGAGVSYTSGFTPQHSGTGIVCFTRMNGVLDINEEDMYVTVQAGCTWKTLYETLKPLGLRTPFWGPLSGIYATIGGGLSQNNAFLGAGTNGSSSGSILSLSVVLGDGSLVKTGSAGTQDSKPFFRDYGPDLTGLFLGDAGALGFKTEITLRLIPTPHCEGWASYEFETAEDWAKAQSAVAKPAMACELFGFDPGLQKVRMVRASLASDLKSLKNVVTGQKGLLKGLKEGAKVAMSGRNFIDKAAYSLHLVVEGHSDPEITAKLDYLDQIAKSHKAKSIENSIPKLIRANPFMPLSNMLGPHGERWVPVHGIVPLSQGASCIAALDALFARLKPHFDKFDIIYGYLTTNLANNGFLIEPVFIWPEALMAIHHETVDKATLKRAKSFYPNPPATALVKEARTEVIKIMTSFGAAHFQIGRTYPFAQTRTPETLALLKAVKKATDPDTIVNPGALGI